MKIETVHSEARAKDRVGMWYQPRMDRKMIIQLQGPGTPRILQIDLPPRSCLTKAEVS